MRQIAYAGKDKRFYEKLVESGKFRCFEETEIEKVKEFAAEVKTDAIFYDMELKNRGLIKMIEISNGEMIPLILLIRSEDELNQITKHLENPYIDFIMKESTINEYAARVEKNISARNACQVIEDISSLNHEVNKMAKLSVAGELIASISHMINNPITSVNLQLDLIKMDKGISKDVFNKIEMIEKNIERIISIVATVRDLKLGISDKYELIDIKDETVRYIPLLHDYFVNHNMIIEYKVDEKIPPIKLPHGLLKYIFLEIMLLLFHKGKNSKGGRVKIDISAKPENIFFEFSTNFKCNLEMLSSPAADENEDDLIRSDKLTLSALKCDLKDANGNIEITDQANSSMVNITLPLAAI